MSIYHFFCVLFTGLIYLVSSSVYADTHLTSNQQVKWLEMDAPPYYIRHGAAKGEGVVQQVSRLLQQHLVNYQHSNKLINLPRALEAMRVGQNVCHGSLYKTPDREAVAYFSSIPSTIFPPVGITIRKEDYAYFGKGSRVSFERILSDREFSGGISNGRSYGKVLDHLLAQYHNVAKLERRSGDDIYRGLIHMLRYKRLDYVLGSPMEASYVQQSLPGSSQIMSLMLEEHDRYDFGYVACSKTPWGKQLINQINALLVQLRPLDSYQSFFTKWLDELSKQSFDKAYHEQFLTMGTQSPDSN